MNALTTFRTPSGDEMVVLPRTEYDRLLDAAEMAADVAAYDEAQRAFAAGEEEYIPLETVKRMIDGENPIRVWREHRGMSLPELAKRASISKGYLSHIENNQRSASVGKLQLIAAALNLTLDDIV
jgi:DNA-binding XRE family transcriptional regulator